MSDNYGDNDIFADEEFEVKTPTADQSNKKWKILVVDDDEDIHTLTRLALDDSSFDGRPLLILGAKSGTEGERILFEQPDIALVLLDVVMESTTAGLQLVKFAREVLENRSVRIVLRTGYPGESPEREVILNYDINGYVTKTELTVDKLFSLVLSSLRAYKTIIDLEALHQELEHKVEKRTYELAESEDKYKSLYDNAPLPYQSLDENGCFIDVNPAWLKKLGFTREEVVGEWYGSFLHPDWQPYFEKNFPAFKKRGYINNVQFKIKHKRGHYLDISFEGCIGYTPDGKFKQTYCVFQDITERKKVENALLHSKQRWEKTFNSISDIITIQDKNRRVIQANKAALQLFSAEHEGLVGKHCYELFSGTSDYCQNCPLLKTIEDIKNYSKIISHEKLGKVFHISSSAIKDDKGELLYLIHVARDITEQKKLEENLFQAYKMEAIGNLAGGIAHDFNNILSAIIGFSELAKESIPPENSAQEDIDLVIKSSLRAADLVQQILTFSRKSDQHMEPLTPHLIIREALKMLRSSLPTTIKIVEDIDNNCGEIMANPTNIHQIIVNLCTNSLHAMEDEKGTLSVSLERKKMNVQDIPEDSTASPGQFIVLQVADTGCGMDKNTKRKIFEPYFTTKEVGKGTGLGLAVIHGIIQDSKGFIVVESKLSQGTTFNIHIPALQQEAETSDKVTTAELIPTGTERILVVDDDDIIANLNKTLLERLGYKVTSITNSSDALKKILNDPSQFDLIVTDQTMPDMTGAELAKEVLRIKPEMLFVLCTGYSSVITEEDTLAIGIKKYVRKPVDKRTLANVVRQVLDGE